MQADSTNTPHEAEITGTADNRNLSLKLKDRNISMYQFLFILRRQTDWKFPTR